MSHIPSRAIRKAIVVLGVALTLPACGGGDDPPPCTTCPPTDLIDQANAALENELFAHLNVDLEDPLPNRPDEVDFSEANGLFQQAFAADATSLTARFGVAITDLLVLSVDAEVNAAFDEWDQYLDERVPFEVDSGSQRPLGIPITPTRGVAALALPFDVIPMTIAARAHPGVFAIDPQFDRTLQILADRVRPRLDAAIDHLSIVGDDPAFTYIVTGRMQGDATEESVEIDQTDIVALRAATRLLIAAIDVALAYNVNIATYDSVGMLTALSPGSVFGTLKNDGAARLQSAHGEVAAAIDDVEEATNLLLAESDSQTNDVIKIGPKDIAQADFDSIRANISNARALLTTGYTRIDNWDDDRSTPAVALTINAGAFFASPIPDLKALAPAYSVRVEQRALNINEEYTFGQAEISVNVVSGRNYSGSAYLEIDDGKEFDYSSGDDEVSAPLLAFLRARLAAAQSDADFVEYSGSASFYGPLPAGTSSVVINHSETVGRAFSYIYVPVIVWEADTFAEWTWPDPTFSGILPGMQSSAQFLSTFGIEAEDWNEELVVDLSELGKAAARQLPPGSAAFNAR